MKIFSISFWCYYSLPFYGPESPVTPTFPNTHTQLPKAILTSPVLSTSPLLSPTFSFPHFHQLLGGRAEIQVQSYLSPKHFLLISALSKGISGSDDTPLTKNLSGVPYVPPHVLSLDMKCRTT